MHHQIEQSPNLGAKIPGLFNSGFGHCILTKLPDFYPPVS
jgi:hypothetical protein